MINYVVSIKFTMKSLKSIIKEHQRKATTEIQKLIVAELNKLKYQPKLYPLIYHRYSEYFSFYVGIIVDGKKYKVEYNGDDNIHFHVKDQIQYVTLGKFKTQIPQQIQKYHDDMEEASVRLKNYRMMPYWLRKNTSCRHN